MMCIGGRQDVQPCNEGAMNALWYVKFQRHDNCTCNEYIGHDKNMQMI